MYEVLVVGAGPVGCKVAELLSKEGIKVLVLEEHDEIGKPLKCAGLVSHRIFKLSNVSKDVVVNVVKKAKFHSRNEFFELKSKKPVYVIDRVKFDKKLGEIAEVCGAEIKTKTEYVGLKRKDETVIVKTRKGMIKTKILVGADGANSSVAKSCRLSLPDNVLVGLQTNVKSIYENEVELWFDSKISPDFFGWVIPEDRNKARVGVATKRKASFYLTNFLRRRFQKCLKVEGRVSGLIRYGLIESSVSDNVLLVGDAACQVKPFSGGGLVYGLIGARIAAEACMKCLEEERFDEEFLKENYDEVWKGELAWPIRKGMMLNKLLHSLSDWELNLLFKLLKIKRIRKFLETWDVDLLK